MTIQEILDAAVLGAQQGCTEALFTLGDKPELLYPEAALELIELGGYKSTIEYVADAAKIVLKETGLLPHINAGVMSDDDVALLKECSVSQGLMLESTSLKLLLAPGQPHYNCPDKVPEVRLATLTAAGKAAIPYTTGLLIGIGESRQDRLDTLLAIKDIHDEYGHIQELIIQPFRAKKNTLMELAPEPSLEELLWTVAVARILFGPYMSIQAPPNLLLTDGDDNGGGEDALDNSNTANKSSGNKFSQVVSKLIGAGINDWGGVSPITKDYVNPEKTWPHVMTLSAATAECGKMLLPRLPVYPQYITQSLINSSSSTGLLKSINNNNKKKKEWLSGKGGRESVLAATLRLVDCQGRGWRGGGV
jgi:FO synthase